MMKTSERIPHVTGCACTIFETRNYPCNCYVSDVDRLEIELAELHKGFGGAFEEMAQRGDRIAILETVNATILDALITYINVPVMADPGHEQELIDAINKAQEAIRKAKEKRDMTKPVKDQECIVNALSIMDEKGRKNQEGNSTMLWNKEWDKLRFMLFALLADNETEAKEK